MINGGPPTAARIRRETGHLVVVYEPGSYAEQHADEVARYAERALDGILQLLKIPGESLLRPHRIRVVVGDTLPAADHPPGTNGRSNGARDGRSDGAQVSVEERSGTTSDLTADVVTTIFTPAMRATGLGEHLARVVVHRLTAAVPIEDRQND